MDVLKYDLYIAGAMHGRSVGEVLIENALSRSSSVKFTSCPIMILLPMKALTN